MKQLAHNLAEKHGQAENHGHIILPKNQSHHNRNLERNCKEYPSNSTEMDW